MGAVEEEEVEADEEDERSKRKLKKKKKKDEDEQEEPEAKKPKKQVAQSSMKEVMEAYNEWKGSSMTRSGRTQALPQSVPEWIKAQDSLFGHLRPLPKNWIRIKSKSSGSMYFYNTKTGKSEQNEPRG